MVKKKTRARSAPRRRPARRAAKSAVPPNVPELLHELQVHAEEITVQNEQLHKAQFELELARDRFADLFDFAPIGYLTLTEDGVIAEINLAGAALLQRQRTYLINVPLAPLIAEHQRKAFQQFLDDAFHGASGASSECSVELQPRGSKTVMRLIARPGTARKQGQLFTAMVDVSDERRLESERGEALAREQALSAERAVEIADRVAAEARVKALLERLVTAQEEERRRIARNLHDHLGQQLTALRLTLDAVSADASMPAALRGRIELVQNIVSKMDRDIDLLAWDLRPATLDDVGLAAALAQLVREWAAVSQVPAEFHDATPQDFRLPDETASNVYRIVQEALNNVAKHAAATHVSVLLEHRGNEAAVIVEDNGRGFNPDLALKSGDRAAMMGLLGMRERAALIDGKVQFESIPGQGTTVFVRIPIGNHA